MVPPQSQANQSAYGQSTLRQWSLTSHARIETVDEEEEKEDDAVQPEPSNNVPGQGNLVAYYQIPYSFKTVAESYRGRRLQDYSPSIVHVPVASPASTSVTSECGSSYGSHRAASPRSTLSASSQPSVPLGGHRTSIRFPVPPPPRPSQWKNAEVRYPSFGVGSRMGIQRPGAGDQPLLQRVAPIEGPTRGGLNIVLIGTDLPWPTAVYARFGSAVAETVSQTITANFSV